MNTKTPFELATPVIRRLIRAMKVRGFPVHYVFDGEEWHKVRGEREAMDVIESVEDSHLDFKNHDTKRTVSFYLVMDNGEEVLCNYGYDPEDEDAVRAAIAEAQKEEA